MKEELLKNLKAKGVDATAHYYNLIVTYPITDTVKWTNQFIINKTTEDTIDKTLWILKRLPEKILAKITFINSPSYHNLFLASNSDLFAIAIDYFKMDNILINVTKDYRQCTIDDFIIYGNNNNITVKKSIVSTKETFEEDLENLLEKFNQL